MTSYYFCRSLRPIFPGPVFFVLYLRLYLIDKHHISCTSSVSHCEWPHIFLQVTVTYNSYHDAYLLDRARYISKKSMGHVIYVKASCGSVTEKT